MADVAEDYDDMDVGGSCYVDMSVEDGDDGEAGWGGLCYVGLFGTLPVQGVKYNSASGNQFFM